VCKKRKSREIQIAKMSGQACQVEADWILALCICGLGRVPLVYLQCGLKYLQCGSHSGSWDGGGIIKENGCGRSEYKGEDVDDCAGIFRFEGENGGTPVWMV
jgi:hypothetical protein